MSTDPREPLAYASPTTPSGAWPLLRLAVIIWASLVLLRHATWWGPLLVDFVFDTSSWRRFASQNRWAIAQVIMEVVILLLAIAVAGRRTVGPRTISRLRLLAIIYCALIIAGFTIEHAGRMGITSAWTAVQLLWLLLSRVQLLVVPILCLVYRPIHPR